MLTVILKILGILGILLLVFLGVVLTVLLLVLFVPVSYRVEACRKPDPGTESAGADPGTAAIRVAARLNWMFGLVRARYFYPDPGTLTVKALFFTLFEYGREQDDTQTQAAQKKSRKKRSEKGSSQKGSSQKEKLKKEELKKENSKKERAEEEAPENESSQKAESQNAESQKVKSQREAPENAGAQKEKASTQSTHDADPQDGPVMKEHRNPFEKLMYTIRRICDKIKRIRENIAHYKAILLAEDTKGLVNHAFMRLGRILRSIRPRKLKADILFGTGSPDTTGYVFGIYGMLCARLGERVLLTPDFERAVLEGELYAAGTITVFKLLWNGLLVALDKRLWELIDKLKEEDN